MFSRGQHPHTLDSLASINSESTDGFFSFDQHGCADMSKTMTSPVDLDTVLDQLDALVYNGMHAPAGSAAIDAALVAECNDWSTRFIQLRVRGTGLIQTPPEDGYELLPSPWSRSSECTDEGARIQSSESSSTLSITGVAPPAVAGQQEPTSRHMNLTDQQQDQNRPRSIFLWSNALAVSWQRLMSQQAIDPGGLQWIVLRHSVRDKASVAQKPVPLDLAEEGSNLASLNAFLSSTTPAQDGLLHLLVALSGTAKRIVFTTLYTEPIDYTNSICMTADDIVLKAWEQGLEDVSVYDSQVDVRSERIIDAAAPQLLKHLRAQSVLECPAEPAVDLYGDEVFAVDGVVVEEVFAVHGEEAAAVTLSEQELEQRLWEHLFDHVMLEIEGETSPPRHPRLQRYASPVAGMGDGLLAVTEYFDDAQPDSEVDAALSGLMTVRQALLFPNPRSASIRRPMSSRAVSARMDPGDEAGHPRSRLSSGWLRDGARRSISSARLQPIASSLLPPPTPSPMLANTAPTLQPLIRPYPLPVRASSSRPSTAKRPLPPLPKQPSGLSSDEHSELVPTRLLQTSWAPSVPAQQHLLFNPGAPASDGPQRPISSFRRSTMTNASRPLSATLRIRSQQSHTDMAGMPTDSPHLAAAARYTARTVAAQLSRNAASKFPNGVTEPLTPFSSSSSPPPLPISLVSTGVAKLLIAQDSHVAGAAVEAVAPSNPAASYDSDQHQPHLQLSSAAKLSTRAGRRPPPAHSAVSQATAPAPNATNSTRKRATTAAGRRRK
ncbi:hypothetical protein RI367_006928 [Sorochytrium milnesiophthora]